MICTSVNYAGVSRLLGVASSHHEDKSPELGERRVDVVGLELEMDGSGARDFPQGLRGLLRVCHAAVDRFGEALEGLADCQLDAEGLRLFDVGREGRSGHGEAEQRLFLRVVIVHSGAYGAAGRCISTCRNLAAGPAQQGKKE